MTEDTKLRVTEIIVIMAVFFIALLAARFATDYFGQSFATIYMPFFGTALFGLVVWFLVKRGIKRRMNEKKQGTVPK